MLGAKLVTLAVFWRVAFSMSPNSLQFPARLARFMLLVLIVVTTFRVFLRTKLRPSRMLFSRFVYLGWQEFRTGGILRHWDFVQSVIGLANTVSAVAAGYT